MKHLVMTEHEKLKIICDKIWYESDFYDNKREIFKQWTWDNEYRMVNVREIIFTEEFMDKYKKYYDSNICPWFFRQNKDWSYWKIQLPLVDDILNNLHNPTQYLYNLLEIWKN